ncbi:MAG: hypothetical protein ACOYNO_07545, partial [Saprospiraceae bacterium]
PSWSPVFGGRPFFVVARFWWSPIFRGRPFFVVAHFSWSPVFRGRPYSWSPNQIHKPPNTQITKSTNTQTNVLP